MSATRFLLVAAVCFCLSAVTIGTDVPPDVIQTQAGSDLHCQTEHMLNPWTDTWGSADLHKFPFAPRVLSNKHLLLE
ncbi:uncharacterized protein LOC120543148 isoform X2 [Polypterus senegalus]|uniref:uncharacterized protein LOC120543148 isoform X2 n=1 Tax=Polypterus senegalus TaxID=55291 RepID=UPI0019642920|nr:uncharacterized protein LOC120543148 isoform X2 [Polypterus senegalus]